MQIVDARSGVVFPLPMAWAKTVWTEDAPAVDYGRGERVEILAVEPGLLSARVRVKNTYRDFISGELTSSTAWLRLPVCYLHPRYPLQPTIILPS